MKIKLLLLLSLWSVSTFAQVRNYAIDEQMFDYQVKGIGEFMARFNGNEHLKFDMNFPDSIPERERDLITLCNLEMANSQPGFKDIFRGFADSVAANDVKLDFIDPTWFANARCKTPYQASELKLNLLMAPHQARPGRYCWTLVDVGGSDAIAMADTTKWVGISPTDNELDFMELAEFSETMRPHFAGIRKPGHDIDYLSAFVALVQAGVMTINHCDKITYYFLSVPGYIFTVDFFNRDSVNSGWLISQIIPIDDEAKKPVYLKQLFNLSDK